MCTPANGAAIVAAGALPGDRRAQEPAARDRRHMQGVAPARRREPGLAQELRDLRARIRPAVAERRRVEARPHAAPVRHHDQQPPTRRQDAPDFAQQGDRIVRHFERVHEQHPVDRGIGAAASRIRRPARRGRAASVGHFTTPCAAGMKARQRSASSRNRPRYGRRIADPEHAHAARIGEALANAASDETARDDAEALGVEIAQIDDIDRHGKTVA